MIEREIDIPSADGAMNSFVVHPDEGGPFPVLLFYMDAPGWREELRDMARRLAAVGYYVVLPNLYYRRTRDFWLRERTEANLAVMFEHMHSLDRRSNTIDTRAMLDFVAADVAAGAPADPRRVGAVGYCMSGPFVVWAAADFADRIACFASIHGANMATASPDSPHLAATSLRAESYHACAEIDKWASPEDIEKLRAGLQASGAPFRIEWYPKLEHGFVFPQRAVYDKPGSERHWVRLFDLFERRLRRTAA